MCVSSRKCTIYEYSRLEDRAITTLVGGDIFYINCRYTALGGPYFTDIKSEVMYDYLHACMLASAMF